MKCIRCGLQKTGKKDFFVCEDCQAFSQIVKTIFSDVNQKIQDSNIIDPNTDNLLMLIADASFISAKNPQVSIFNKTCEYIIKKAYSNCTEITEEELNRAVKTIKSWGDTFKTFEALNLIEVQTDEYQRIIKFTETTQKLAHQFDNEFDGASSLSQQIHTRLAHIYAGYVLLYILNNVAKLNEGEEDVFIPYNQKPKTMWVFLMYLWNTAYNGEEEFSDQSLTKFVSRRRIPSTTRGQLITALQSMSATTVQGLIKEIKIAENESIFKFEDYVMIELKRIRDQRERER
jgi:hypothetical protein